MLWKMHLDHLSVCRLVSLQSVLWQNGLADPFGVVSGVGQGMGILDGVVIIKGEGPVLGVKLGRPIVTNEAFVA